MIYLHISLTGGQSAVQSANTALSKSNNCTLEETAVLQIIQQNPRVTQKLNKHRTSTEQVEDEKHYSSDTSDWAREIIHQRDNGQNGTKASPHVYG